ncbi:uncharacterized protein LOC131286631 [Anopheles ziemanni]|uniref:uncharacterized protein LOC131262776 n=1 Tax=Anopheles coustani TaxID=139045 RepID=UPI00265A85DC|nr:uncharacterized protein LOC131262776 [Anopheles coustani]XP_058171599.1 uncharacterized protein LOC131286631 [Anopheles ziemanni]
MGYSVLRNILKETNRRIELLDLPYEEEFRCQLKYLGFKEKYIVKEAFFRQEWNIGSTRVLRLLQEANILTASEFILSLESIDLTQQIMNDLLEAEYVLLANIIQFAYQETPHSQLLTKILKESFGTLIADLKENPNAIPRNYLLALKNHLSKEKMIALKNEHLHMLVVEQDLLELHVAIGKQEQWRCEMEMLSKTIVGGMIVELIEDKNSIVNIFKELIGSCSSFSVRYILYILNLVSRTIGMNKKESTPLKELMKDLFRMVVNTGLLSKLQLMLLFAREICSSNESILGTYSEWYKQTIGEMTYSIKKEQFINMMEMLTSTLSSETSLDILAVHSTIAISAPAKCNDYVVNYKQLCRAHISQLKSPDVTIVVDD